MHAPATPPLWSRPFLLIALAHLVMTIGFYSTMPVYSLFLEDRFGLEGLILGLAVASYTATSILIRPPAGHWLDKYGRKILYLPAYALFALVYWLYPLADGMVSVTLVRVLHGALWGVTMGAASTAAVDVLPPQRRGEGIGYFGLAMIFGMSVGPALGTFLATEYGYNILFRTIGLLTAAGFLVLCLAPFPVISRSARPLSLRTLLEPSSLPASAATLISCIPYGVIMNYTSLYARTLPGASAGSFFLCLAAGTALSRLRSGAVFDTRGPGGIMALGYAFLLSGFVMLGLAQGPGLFAASGLLLGLGYGITAPVLQAMVNGLVQPQRRGAANATLMTAFDLGIFLGILTMSPLAASVGWRTTFAVLTGCVAVSALVFRYSALPRYLRAQSPARGD